MASVYVPKLFKVTDAECDPDSSSADWKTFPEKVILERLDGLAGARMTSWNVKVPSIAF